MNQTLKDIEIILIDDGSTDRSGELADYFQEQDSRIKVVHQENKGLSAARNIGLDMAQGTYIAFVDSDDWIVKNALERLVAAANKDSADLVAGDTLFSYQNGTKKVKFKKKNQTNYSNPLKGSECFVKLFKDGSYAPMACNYLYKREYIESHHFRFALTVHEDELWTLIVMCLAEKVKVINFTFYNYRIHEGSISQSTKYKERYQAYIFVANQLIIFSSNYNFNQHRELKSWIYLKIYTLYFYAYTILPIDEVDDKISVYNCMELFFQSSRELSEEPFTLCSDIYLETKKRFSQKNKNSSEL